MCFIDPLHFCFLPQHLRRNFFIIHLNNQYKCSKMTKGGGSSGISEVSMTRVYSSNFQISTEFSWTSSNTELKSDIISRFNQNYTLTCLTNSEKQPFTITRKSLFYHSLYLCLYLFSVKKIPQFTCRSCVMFFGKIFQNTPNFANLAHWIFDTNLVNRYTRFHEYFPKGS